MAEYIERAALVEALRKYQYPYGVEFLVSCQPASDVAPAKGEKHAKAKLTELDVLTIRKKRLQGVSFGKLAKEYGVCKKTIQDAVSGKHWSYLPQPPKGE